MLKAKKSYSMAKRHTKKYYHKSLTIVTLSLGLLFVKSITFHKHLTCVADSNQYVKGVLPFQDLKNSKCMIFIF